MRMSEPPAGRRAGLLRRGEKIKRGVEGPDEGRVPVRAQVPKLPVTATWPRPDAHCRRGPPFGDRMYVQEFCYCFFSLSRHGDVFSFPPSFGEEAFSLKSR